MSKGMVLATANDFGGSNAITPVIGRLLENDYDIVALNVGKLPIVLGEKIEGGGTIYQSVDMLDICEDMVGDLITAISTVSPNVVLTGTSVQSPPNLVHVPDQQLVVAARDAGVPSVSMCDLFQYELRRVSDITQGDAGRFAFLPDKLGIIDRSQKIKLMQLYFPESNLEVIGNPTYDRYMEELAEFNEDKRQDVLEKVSLGRGDKKFVAFMSQPIAERLKDVAEKGLDQYTALTCFLKGYNGCLPVVVKSNRDDPIRLENIADRNENGNTIVNTDDGVKPGDLVLSSSLVATPFSTDYLRALYSDIPAIAVQPGDADLDRTELATWTHRGLIPIVTSSSAVDTSIELATYGVCSERRKDMEKPDGKSLNNAYVLVTSMVA